MLCTANYEARKYGITSAMPGYIAKKLCPQLVIVGVNFEKYSKYGEIIRNIFGLYDKSFSSYSLDEASLNVTGHLSSHAISCEDLILEMKRKVFNATGLTCSVGCASTRFLAKICSNVNKPNGCFILHFGRKETEDFLCELPVRKLFGVGKVTEKILFELFHIQKCKEIWDKRYEIYYVFESTFIIESAYGLIQNYIHEDDVPVERKSISSQRTFKATSSLFFQLKVLAETVENACAEMSQRQFLAKTISLKLKTSMFDYVTRNITIEKYTNDADTVFLNAKSMLIEYRKENTHLRLLGVGLSNFLKENDVDENFVDISQVRHSYVILVLFCRIFLHKLSYLFNGYHCF